MAKHRYQDADEEAGEAPQRSLNAVRNRGLRPAAPKHSRFRRFSLVESITWQEHRPGWLLVIWVVALDVVLLAPLVGRGTLWLLDLGDYPEGPHPPFAYSAYGFPPGLTSRAPVDAALYWIFQGIHWAPLHLLPFAALAPLSCIGFMRIFRRRALAIGAATLLYTVNPFIYERMASGQVYVVMGYSLLPILLGLAVSPFGSLIATAALGGFFFALDTALSVHYLFIAGLLLLFVMLSYLAVRQIRVTLATGGITAAGFLLSLYWLIPAVRAVRAFQSPVTTLDLSAFHTLADNRLGVGVNVAGLYGFWRSGIPLVKNQLSGWPFILVALLVVVAFGVHELAARGRSNGRGLALTCVTLGVAGGILALGARGPTAGMYEWLFAHIPGFKVMREAEKFSSLLALGYAVCFGVGTETMVRQVARNLWKVLAACCITALPLVYGYTELWGFDGYVGGYPASWAAADQSMRAGGAALALPWKAYLQVPWAGNRMVANPMQSYFSRPVISANSPEVGPESAETADPRALFLQFCLSVGNQVTEFGRLLAPLGIRYVLLAKVPGAQSYGWLSQQRDLRRVFDAGSIAVYENEEVVPIAYEPTRRLILQDWGQVVALAQHTPIIDYLIEVRHPHPGPLTAPMTALRTRPRAPASIGLQEVTPVSAVVDVPRVARSVAFTNPAYPGWQLKGFRTTSQFGVTTAFVNPRGPDYSRELAANYAPWRLVESCDIAGTVLLLGDAALLVLLFIRYRRRTVSILVKSQSRHGGQRPDCAAP